MFAGFDKDRIIQCLQLLSHQSKGATRMLEIVKDYESKNVSDKVIRIMLSYTNFINQKIWKK
jgi:UDP-N-acetylglucosamine 2-epimerase (non-hydrolysing)